MVLSPSDACPTSQYYTRTVAYRDPIPNGDCNSAWRSGS